MTCTPTWPAACRSSSPPSTCRSRSPSPRRRATARSPSGTVAIGEVGLLGELRAVVGLERRLREAARLGFGRAIVPHPSGGTRLPVIDGLEVVPVATLRDAIAAALADRPSPRGEAVPAMLG